MVKACIIKVFQGTKKVHKIFKNQKHFHQIKKIKITNRVFCFNLFIIIINKCLLYTQTQTYNDLYRYS